VYIVYCPFKSILYTFPFLLLIIINVHPCLSNTIIFFYKRLIDISQQIQIDNTLSIFLFPSTRDLLGINYILDYSYDVLLPRLFFLEDFKEILKLFEEMRFNVKTVK